MKNNIIRIITILFIWKYKNDLLLLSDAGTLVTAQAPKLEAHKPVDLGGRQPRKRLTYAENCHYPIMDQAGFIINESITDQKCIKMERFNENL
jgi:hypothetical protein